MIKPQEQNKQQLEMIFWWLAIDDYFTIRA